MSRSYYSVRDRWSTRAGQWVLYALAWIFLCAIWPFSTWAVTRALAPVGGLLATVIPGWRRRADANLSLVWPEIGVSDRRALIYQIGAQFTRLTLEYIRLDRFIKEVRLTVTGAEHLAAAQSAGRGTILVTAHYGNWEAARLAAKQAGVETGIIYRAFNNRYIDRYAFNLIPITGVPVLQKGRKGARQLVKHVLDGGAIMILVDQRNSGAPYLDFMGHPAETVTAAADLAHRTGAALIPARAVRVVEERRFEVSFEEPITGPDPHTMMQQVNARIGAWVEEHPDQWFWFHRRWRSTARSKPLPERR